MAGFMAFLMVLNLFFGGVFINDYIADRSRPIDNDYVIDIGMNDTIDQNGSGWIRAMPRPGDDPPPPQPPGP